MIVTSIKKLIGLLHSEERGQVLYLVVGLLIIFGGMTAGAIDYGSYAADRRDLQNAADAIALAASQELPDEDAAIAAANDWAANNDIDTSLMTVTVIQQSIPSQPNPEVQVQIDDEHDFYFARMIGVNSADVGAKAVAIKTSPAGGSGMVPLSVTQAALAGAGLGDEVVLKYDANQIENGNTSPIRIDGGGTGNCDNADQYCGGVMNGTETIICAAGADTTYCSGPSVVDTQPGNLVGGTRDAITCRITDLGDPSRNQSNCPDNVYTDSQCDEFTETFEDDPTSSDPGTYRITQECNPYLAGGYSSMRIVIVPVIEEFCPDQGGGACAVTIVDFALFFLEGFAPGPSCNGVDCEVIGRFVRVNQNIGLLAGTFDENSLNSFVRLIE